MFLRGSVLCLLLCSCETTYDPSYRGGEVPCYSALKAEQCFVYEETAKPLLTTEDLTKDMPLSKLLDMALLNNPKTRVSWNAARAAAFGYHVSLSEYYPTINYSGNVAIDKSNTSGSAFSSNNTSDGLTGINTRRAITKDTMLNQVTLSYLLLDFGGRDAQAAEAFQGLVAANWQHNLTIQQVILSVINSYTSYLSNQALLIGSEQDFKDAQVTVEAAEKMKAHGLATKTDVLSARSTLEQMRYNLEQARGAEKTSYAGLLIALGLPQGTCICVEGLPEKLPVVEISGDVCCLIELAKERRPDIGLAIAQVEQQQEALIVSYSSGMPTLTLNGNMQRGTYLKPRAPSAYDENVSLNWNVPLFAGFYYVNQQRQIRAQIDEALANVDLIVAQVVLDVVTNYYAYTTAEASIPSSDALLEYSDLAYRSLLSQYKMGGASMLDVLNTLTTLSNARYQHALTRSQWAASLANLAFSVGVLDVDSGKWKKSPVRK